MVSGSRRTYRRTIGEIGLFLEDVLSASPYHHIPPATIEGRHTACAPADRVADVDAALTIGIGVVAVALLVALVLAARTGRRTPTAVVVPAALVAAVAAVRADSWPATAWVLVAALLGRPRHSRVSPVDPAPGGCWRCSRSAAWSRRTARSDGCCAQVGTDPCETPGADLAVLVGGSVAGTAAVWLYVAGALGR
jgi:hypothetical protein